MKLICSIFVIFTFFGCQSKISRLHKAKILDVTMDPAKVASPHESASNLAFGFYENTIDVNSQSFGGSCPTCGSYEVLYFVVFSCFW